MRMLSYSCRDINASRSPGKFFSGVPYPLAPCLFATREPLRVVMFVINFQCRAFERYRRPCRVSITTGKVEPCILAKLHYAYLGVSPLDT